MKNIFIFSIFTFSIIISNAKDNWTQKANFGGAGRNKSIHFSIGEKGYVGSGNISQTLPDPSAADLMGKPTNDFWEYDPAKDKWTQKANMPKAHFDGFSFSIGGKGYVGLGYTGISSFLKDKARPTDFWEYDPETNKWNKKSDFPNYSGSHGFAYDGKGYVMSYSSSGDPHLFTKKEDYGIWEYDPSADSWTKKSGLHAKGKSIMFYFVFVIDNTVYFGENKTIYAYDVKNGTWSEKTKYKTGMCEAFWVYFTYNGKGYFGGGECPNETVSRSIYVFDPVKNTVTKEGEFFKGIQGAIAFSIGNRVFGGLGRRALVAKSKDWYEFKPE